MDLSAIFKGDKNSMDKYAEFWASQTNFSCGASKLTQGRYFLKKLKMKAGDGLVVFPLMIHLPIDFSGNMLPTAIPYAGSYVTTIKLIKLLASTNANYQNSLKKVLDEDFGVLDLTDVEEVTDEEKKVFKRFRHLLIYAHTVMSVKAADSTFSFGTPYSVDIAVDPESGNYIDDPHNPLIWNLHKLETSCLAAKIKKIREDNEAAGDAKRTDSEIADQIKSIWENRCISNPYPLGTTRVLFFDTDRNYEIDKNLVDKWDVKDGCKNNEYYIKINRDLYALLESDIGTKYDRYDDFLLIKQNTPDFDKNNQGLAAQKISRTPAGSDEAIETMLKEFSSAYREYRDNIEIWDEKIIRTSAFEYRTISDQAIADIFKNSMPELSAAMHTTEIYDKYSETIAILDPKLSDELLGSAMEGALTSTGDISAEVASAPNVDENTVERNGGVNDTEAAEAMLKALSSDN